MYCINCGVKLSDTEKKCPLCGTEVYHPTLKQGDASPLYPKNRNPKLQAKNKDFKERKEFYMKNWLQKKI